MPHKTLDELEGVVWGPPNCSSGLVTTCYRLRTKPVGEFEAEDLRIMIGQNIGLPWLLSLAIDRLEENPWASGDLYPGDLLRMTARAEFFWHTRVELRERLRVVLERALLGISMQREKDATDVPGHEVPTGEWGAEFAAELCAALERLDADPGPGPAVHRA